MMDNGHIVNNQVYKNDPSAPWTSTAQIKCLTP